MKYKTQSFICKLILCLCAFIAAANAQTTDFTYQGRFTDATVQQPTNGTYQMQFALLDASNAQIGATITNPTVQVVNGIFTVNLNFGANAFSGASRFLQISVFTTATNSFVALNPRQPVSSAPYAIKSLNAANADTATNSTQLGGINANQYVKEGDSRLTDSRDPNAGSGSYVQNRTTQQTGTNFNIDGNGTTGGTLSGSAVSSATQYNINGVRILGNAGTNNLFAGIGAGNSNTGIGNTFVGRNAGFANTSGASNSFFGGNAGDSNTSGGSNSFFGRFSGGANTNGDNNTFLGYNAGIANTTGNGNTVIGAGANLGAGNLTNATAIGVGAVVDENNTIILGTTGTATKIKGNLSVGSLSGNKNLDVYGTVYSAFVNTNLASGGNGQVCLKSDFTLAYCSSSLRYKTNVAPFSSGLNLVNRLRPITFDWKSDGKHDLGLGAEDVAAIEPLLVTYNKDGQIEGVKYDRIGVVLLNAVKEQQAQIERQQILIDELKKLVCAGNNSQAEVCK